jgi:hypothetical protein
MTIKNPRFIKTVIADYHIAKLMLAEVKYEMKIAESQAKLAETDPSYTKI